MRPQKIRFGEVFNKLRSFLDTVASAEKTFFWGGGIPGKQGLFGLENSKKNAKSLKGI